MAINKARIQEILDRWAEHPEPERQVFIVKDIEHLMSNPKTKFGHIRSAAVAIADELVAAHKPELTAEERAKFIADNPHWDTGLNPDLDQAELAREVRRHRRKLGPVLGKK